MASSLKQLYADRLNVDPRRSIARDQRPLRVWSKSRRDYSPLADEAAQLDGDEHVVSQARRSGHRLAHAIGSNVTRSYLRTSMLKLRRPVLASWASFVCGETRRQRGRASQGRGVIPSREFSEIWKPRTVGDRRGASALEATIAVRHDDASPHKWGGEREHGPRRWKRP
jgi:hypothetical protein